MSSTETICDALEKIGKNKHRRAMLDFFCENGVERWETWLQLEMAKYMSDNLAQNWWIESKYEVDRRTQSEKKHRHIDLVFRTPNSSTVHYGAVEMKVRNYPEYSIGNVMKDLRTIAQIKRAQWNFRSVHALAIFLYSNTSSSYRARAEELGEIVNLGPYTCAVFGWESPGLGDANQVAFGAWVNQALN